MTGFEPAGTQNIPGVRPHCLSHLATSPIDHSANAPRQTPAQRVTSMKARRLTLLINF